MSKVGRYHVCFKSSELYHPQIVDKNQKEMGATKKSETTNEEEKKQVLSKLDTSVLSNTITLDGPERPSIAFRNKSKISLSANYQ